MADERPPLHPALRAHLDQLGAHLRNELHNPSPGTRNLEALHAAWRRLTPDQRDELLAYAQRLAVSNEQ